jgi:hypothetical protein
MVHANIDIFEMTYEESVSYFKQLENLEKIRRTNGPNPSSLPVDNKKPVTSSAGKSSKNHKGSNTIVTRIPTTRLIAERFPNSNSRKRIALDCYIFSLRVQPQATNVCSLGISYR